MSISEQTRVETGKEVLWTNESVSKDGCLYTVSLKNPSAAGTAKKIVHVVSEPLRIVPYSNGFVNLIREIHPLHIRTWSSSICFTKAEKAQYTFVDMEAVKNCKTAKERAEKIVQIAAQKVAHQIIQEGPSPRTLKYQVQCFLEQMPMSFLDDETKTELRKLFSHDANYHEGDTKTLQTEEPAIAIASKTIQDLVIIEASGKRIASLVNGYKNEIRKLQEEQKTIQIYNKSLKNHLNDFNYTETLILNRDLIYRNQQMVAILESLHPCFALETRLENWMESRNKFLDTAIREKQNTFALDRLSFLQSSHLEKMDKLGEQFVDKFDAAMEDYCLATQMILYNRSLVAIYNGYVDQKDKLLAEAESAVFAVTETRARKELEEAELDAQKQLFAPNIPPNVESIESFACSTTELTPGKSPASNDSVSGLERSVPELVIQDDGRSPQLLTKPQPSSLPSPQDVM